MLPLLNAAEAGSLVVFAALAGSAWWRGLDVADRDRPALPQLLRWTVPIIVAAVVVPCFLTADPVDYVVRGRILALHDGNHTCRWPRITLTTPFLHFGDRGWKSMPLPYGPIVANIQGVVAWLAHQLPVSPQMELIVALVLFKLLFGLAHVGCAICGYRLAQRLIPGSEAWAFVAIAWNPLILNDCVANAHNESLVLLCLLFAVAGAGLARFGSAALAIGAGTLTKIVPVLISPPLFAMAVRQRRVGNLLAGAAVALALAALFYWQFFRDPAALSVVQRQTDLQGGSWWWAVHQVTGIELATLTLVGRALVVAWVAVMTQQIWRRPDLRLLVFATATSLLGLAVLGAPLFGSWYHVWWLPFGLLLRRGYVFRVAVVASFTAPLAYFVRAGWRRWDDPSQWWSVTWSVLLPLLLPLLWRRWPTRSRAIDAAPSA